MSVFLEDVPERLWGTSCPLCDATISRGDAEADDGAVTVTFFRGKFRLVHSQCLEAFLHPPEHGAEGTG